MPVPDINATGEPFIGIDANYPNYACCGLGTYIWALNCVTRSNPFPIKRTVGILKKEIISTKSKYFAKCNGGYSIQSKPLTSQAT